MSFVSNLISCYKTLIIMTSVLLLGFVTDFMARVRDGKVKPPLWQAFLLDAPGAALMGIVAYGAGTHFGLSEQALAAVVGIAGHVGGRGLYFMEQIVWKTLQKKIES